MTDAALCNIEDVETRATILLRAGQAAAQIKDYPTAYQLLRQSSDLDPDQHWLKGYLEALETLLRKQVQ